jgi:hypothetical protein
VAERGEGDGSQTDSIPKTESPDGGKRLDDHTEDGETGGKKGESEERDALQQSPFLQRAAVPSGLTPSPDTLVLGLV